MSLNTRVGGPYFDDLTMGQVFDSAPAVTLDRGTAAAHRAIVGDRLRLSLDAELARSVTGATLVSPALVWNLAVGQSTLVTQRVKANLFYRGLRLRRFPAFGDSLHTRTEIVGLRQNAPRPGRYETGLAALRITTCDQNGAPVLDFWRCAMLPRDPALAGTDSGRHDDLTEIGAHQPADWSSPPNWDLKRFHDVVGGSRFDADLVGAEWQILGGDVVTSAPELARLTLNIATAHHDSQADRSGTRLVYGGHTIGLALSQILRVLPDLVTVLGWHSCDHSGPVYEGDTLTSTVRVERADSLPGGGGVLHLRSLVCSGDREVLDWRLAALVA